MNQNKDQEWKLEIEYNGECGYNLCKKSRIKNVAIIMCQLRNVITKQTGRGSEKKEMGCRECTVISQVRVQQILANSVK